jgi:hypothetical protein
MWARTFRQQAWFVFGDRESILASVAVRSISVGGLLQMAGGSATRERQLKGWLVRAQLIIPAALTRSMRRVMASLAGMRQHRQATSTSLTDSNWCTSSGFVVSAAFLGTCTQQAAISGVRAHALSARNSPTARLVTTNTLELVRQ